MPIWPKGDSRNEFLNRITGCDLACQSELLDGGNSDEE